MKIFTVSQIMSMWYVNRYDETTKSVLNLETKIRSEEEALKRAFIKAEDDRPSKVMLFSRGGESKVVAEFER